jgi:chaperonin GroES
MNNGGDVLARGGHRAQFAQPEVSAEEYEKRVGAVEKKPLGVSDEEFERAKEEARRILEAVKSTEETNKLKFSDGRPGFRAIQDRVIVKRTESQDKVGSLFVADESKEKPAEGIVVAVGPGRYLNNGQFIGVSVVVGEYVLFGKFSGMETKINGEVYVILREEDLLAVRD